MPTTPPAPPGTNSVPSPLGLDGSVELAVLERSGFPESRHIGAAVLVDVDGHVVRAVGDARALVLPRSTLKPVQALAVLGTGASFTDEELVLGIGSHCGSPAHLAVVEGMLAADGRDASALQCPAQWPLGARERAARQAAGLGPAPITMNCSGKHAAFLRASDALGADASTYLAADHPLQRRILQTVEEWTGEKVHRSGIDGCGAPVHATSLVGLARATARIAAGVDERAARLMAAVQAQPWAIDGPGRANTVAIARLGVLAKIGAEGLVVIGTPSGHAVAVKVLDGSMRATTPVALALLVAERLIDPAIAAEVAAVGQEPVLGGDTVVGGLRVTAL